MNRKLWRNLIKADPQAKYLTTPNFTILKIKRGKYIDPYTFTIRRKSTSVVTTQFISKYRAWVEEQEHNAYLDIKEIENNIKTEHVNNKKYLMRNLLTVLNDKAKTLLKDPKYDLKED